MNYGLKENQIQQILSVFSKFKEIDKAILFGSRAKGNYRPSSDIDLVLIGDKLNLTLLNQIELELDDLYIPNYFDISIFHQISNQDLIDHINRVGIVIYNRKV